MGKYIYIGCFINPGDLYPRIRKLYPSGLEQTIQFPHITLDFRPKKDFYVPLFGEKIEITVTGYGNNGKNEGVKVQLRSKNRTIQRLIATLGPNRIPHITLSVSDGSQPRDTCGLLFQKLSEPFVITGYFGAYCEGGYVDTGCISTTYGPPVKTTKKESLMTFEATVNKTKQIKACSLTELKRKASRAANSNHNTIDTMTVTVLDGNGPQAHLEFTRINQIYPNNTICRGTWI